MSISVISGILFALGAGVAIGIQTLVINLTGQSLSPLRTGFMIHVMGALVGGILVLFFTSEPLNIQAWQFDQRILLLTLAGGMCGMVIVPTVALAIPIIGQTAAQAVIIFAQISVAVVVDTLGIAGEPIPFDSRRLIGLLLLLVAIYFLIPSE